MAFTTEVLAHFLIGGDGDNVGVSIDYEANRLIIAFAFAEKDTGGGDLSFNLSQAGLAWTHVLPDADATFSIGDGHLECYMAISTSDETDQLVTVSTSNTKSRGIHVISVDGADIESGDPLDALIQTNADALNGQPSGSGLTGHFDPTTEFSSLLIIGSASIISTFGGTVAGGGTVLATDYTGIGGQLTTSEVTGVEVDDYALVPSENAGGLMTKNLEIRGIAEEVVIVPVGDSVYYDQLEAS